MIGSRKLPRIRRMVYGVEEEEKREIAFDSWPGAWCLQSSKKTDLHQLAIFTFSLTRVEAVTVQNKEEQEVLGTCFNDYLPSDVSSQVAALARSVKLFYMYTLVSFTTNFHYFTCVRPNLKIAGWLCFCTLTYKTCFIQSLFLLFLFLTFLIFLASMCHFFDS